MKGRKRIEPAAILSLSLCIGSIFAIPACAATVGPLGDRVESGYDAETWARLQDNVLEYDEIRIDLSARMDQAAGQPVYGDLL